MQEEESNATNFQKVVDIVQAAFRNGMLSVEITWKTVILITKGYIRYFQGIGLVDVIWKTVTELLN